MLDTDTNRRIDPPAKSPRARFLHLFASIGRLRFRSMNFEDKAVETRKPWIINPGHSGEEGQKRE